MKILKVVPDPKRSYLCDSHAESVGEEQAGVPLKQRAMPQEWQSDEEERRAALLNMHTRRGRERDREREERGGDRQVSVSGSLSTEGLIAAAVK